jgi:hypothetical protein
MNGGEISGNSAAADGGGVYVVPPYGRFTKQSDGVIYGSDASDTLKNTAASGNGHAVFVALNSNSFSPEKWRNTTAGSGVILDSGVGGASGGWE